MGRYRFLAKNIGILTISSFATKLLNFFFVPLYTNILTTSEYGTYDLINTIIGILVPILTLNIMESVLRFSIDDSESHKAVLTIGLQYLIKSTGIIIIFLVINHVFEIIEIVDSYAIYFAVLFFLQALSGIVLSFARGKSYFTDISVSSVLCTCIVIVTNILFLVVFRWGMIGYCLANIIGTLVQNIYLLVRIRFWEYISVQQKFLNEKKEMLAYCKPMIANSIGWWINGISDRIVVTWICGISENGIYSVATKIPSVLNIFQTIFNQAWTLSAVKDYDSEDKNGFFTIMYNSYNCMMVMVCSVLIIVARILAKFLYAKGFYSAWQYVPFLLIAILFGALSGYIDGIFLAAKDSKILARSTTYGAVTNVILNIVLVPHVGALGAAIATSISYWVIWCVRVVQVKKYIKIKINLVRDYIVYIVLVIQAIVLLYYSNESLVLYLSEIMMLFLIGALYIKEIRFIFNKGMSVLSIQRKRKFDLEKNN